jgi:hypothetical protein
MRHWNEQTDAEARTFFASLPESEIRRRQDLCQQQIRIAHARRMDDALHDLRRMESALARSMMDRL